MKFSPLQSLRDKLAGKGEQAFESVPLSAYGKLSGTEQRHCVIS